LNTSAALPALVAFGLTAQAVAASNHHIKLLAKMVVSEHTHYILLTLIGCVI